MDWGLLWESAKEPLRELVMAIIPVVLAWLNTISAPWAVVLYLAIRMLDSWLHEYGVANSKTTLEKGLTRF